MKVVPINSLINEYKTNLDLLKKHQTFPLLMLTIQSAIDANSNLKDISEILDSIFTCSDDQFWCLDGSEYFENNKKTFNTKKINLYRDKYPTTLTSLNYFWKIIANYSDLELAYGCNYLSLQDFHYLENGKFLNKDEFKKYLEEDENKVSINNSDSILNDEFMSLMTKSLKSEQLAIEERYKFNDAAEKDGLSYFPNIYLISNYKFFQKYKDEFKSLSSYFEKYFFNPKENNQPESKKLSKINNAELIKIISSVLFSRLMINKNIKVQYNSVDEILLDRITNPSFQKFIKNPENDFDYTVLLMNLLMMSSLSGVGSIENNILIKEEVTLENLIRFYPSFEFIETKLMFLPGNIISKVPYSFNIGLGPGIDKDFFLFVSKGKYCDEYDGELKNYIAVNFDKNKNTEFLKKIKKYIFQQMSNWLIPLQNIHDINYITDFRFFDEDTNRKIVSDALQESDVDDEREFCLLSNMLIEPSFSRNYLYEDYFIEDWFHPALHIIYFIHAIQIEDSRRWIDLSSSLQEHNQPYYSCLVISLFFYNRLFIESLNNDDEDLNFKNNKIDTNSMINLLSTISSFPSFNIVQESIKDYLSFGRYSEIDKGFLSAFLKGKNKVSILKKSKNIINLYEYKKLNFNFDQLYEGSNIRFQEAIVLLNEDRFNLSNKVRRAYFLIATGLEIEFQHRTRNLNLDDMKELIQLDFNVENYQDTEKFSLGNFIYLIKIFPELIEKTQFKMNKIKSITIHSKLDDFIELLFFILKKRNVIVHPSIKTKEDEDEILEGISDFRKKFLHGCFFEVLCSKI